MAATFVMLRIGGVAPGVIPSGALSLALLAVLAIVGRVLGLVEARGRERAIADTRAWVTAHGFGLGLACIVVAAAWLRFFGIAGDLGHVALQIDENRLNQSVLNLFRTGDINYRTVEHYPGVHYWLLVGTYLLAYVWGLMSDVATTLARMPVEYFAAAGRMVSAAMSTGTVMITGLLGRRLAGPRVGLAAAALLAIGPLPIIMARQVRNDATQTLLCLAAVYVALGVYRRTHAAWEPALGGVLAGLATGVKYTAVFVLVPVMLAAVTCEDPRRRARALGLAVCGFLVAALVSNHFVWADLPNLVDQLSDQILITGEGHWAAQANPPAYHARILAGRVLGWPLLLLAAATAAYRLAVGPWSWRLFLTYPLFYIWFVSQRPSQLPRWVYPAAPFAAIAACAGLIALIELVEARFERAEPSPRWRALATPALVLVFFAPMLAATTTNLSRQFSPPTYALTEEWLEDNTAPADRVLLQRNWLDLDPERHDLRRPRSIRDVLNGGRYELATHDWVVVQEGLFQNPTLERLRLAEAINVAPYFGGNQGPDFRIFAVPEAEPIEGPMEVRIDGPGSRDYLGNEWPPRRPEEVGRLVPTEGARIFLPPLGARTRRLELVFAEDPAGGAPDIELFAAGRRLDLSPPQVADTDVLAPGSATRVVRVTIELSLGTVGPRVVELYVQAATTVGAARIFGFRLE